MTYFSPVDIFLLCRVKKNLLKIKHCLPYSQFVIEDDVPPSLLPPVTDLDIVCALVVPKMSSSRQLLLIFNTKQDKKDFVVATRNLCEKEDPNKRVFGSSLVALLKREKTPNKTIPTALESMVEVIKSRVEVEGIFRVSCSVKDLHAIKDAIEREETDLRNYDVHTVANALKTYFRAMPEPLMTFPAYDDLTAITEETQQESRISSLKRVIANMPKANRDVLQWLLFFLNYVADFSDKNLMTCSNLAIVIGPNLVRPIKNTLETTLMMPRLNSIVADLIEHAKVIFDKLIC